MKCARARPQDMGGKAGVESTSPLRTREKISHKARYGGQKRKKFPQTLDMGLNLGYNLATKRIGYHEVK